MLEQGESEGVSAADESPGLALKHHPPVQFLVEIEEVEASQTAIVHIVGEFDMAGVKLFKQMVTEAVLLDAFVSVSLDFERLTFLDSSGLGALLAAKKVADGQGIQLNFINVARGGTSSCSIELGRRSVLGSVVLILVSGPTPVTVSFLAGR